MKLFQKSIPDSAMQKTIHELSNMMKSLAPLFLDALCLNATEYIKASILRRDESSSPSYVPFTDESALRRYGKTRRDLALITLHAYQIHCLMSYLPGQQILIKKDEEKLLSGIFSELVDESSKDHYKKEWDKIIFLQPDRGRLSGLTVGNLLATVGVLDSQFYIDDKHKIYSQHVPLLEFMCLCIMLKVDGLFNPKKYPSQFELYLDYKNELSKSKLELDKIERALSLQS